MDILEEDKLKPLGVSETAEYLGVPVSAVYGLFKSKEIKSMKVGKRLKTNKAAIEEYLSKISE